MSSAIFRPARWLAWSLVAILALSASSPFSLAQESQPSTTALKLGTASQKVPAGTVLKISFNSTLDSRITPKGEPFSAFVGQDFMYNDIHGYPRVILPKGTMIRGRIDDVKRPGLFSRGGSITLAFDHVVLPTGDLLPLDLNLSAQNDMVKRLNGPQGEERYVLYSDPGIGQKMQEGLQSGVQTVGKFKDAGVSAGKDLVGGAGMLVTVPAAVVGGVVAGTAVTTGKGVKALIGRGDSVTIQPGDSLNVDFGGAFNLPAD